MIATILSRRCTGKSVPLPPDWKQDTEIGDVDFFRQLRELMPEELALERVLADLFILVLEQDRKIELLMAERALNPAI